MPLKSTLTTCPQCGQAMEVTSKRPRVFCSTKCSARARPRRSVEERFNAYVQKAEKCWLWTGPRNQSGYGLFWVNGKLMLAHRYSWESVHGPIPEGMGVLHSCDTPPCVNPYECLFLGTGADNSADMVAKSRQAVGVQIPQAKLTDDAVRDIRRRLAVNESEYAIADSYGVSRGAIGYIKRGQTWRHVT